MCRLFYLFLYSPLPHLLILLILCLLIAYWSCNYLVASLVQYLEWPYNQYYFCMSLWQLFQFFQGSVSVSMSIYQTFFCFICTHLTSGEKEGDELKRNTDVHEILRRTHFHSPSYIGLPKGILDHEWVQALVTIKYWLVILLLH